MVERDDWSNGMDPAPSAPPVAPAFRNDRPYLAGLNDHQRQAVEALNGPVLVLAGAGTGKTRVLTTRMAHLLATGTARPWNVLAVTFTNKAAREMRDRISAIIGPAAEQVWLGTFHALGAKFLRRHAELVGLQSNFTILDTDDQQRLLKQILKAEDIDDKQWPARVVLGVLQRWKDRGLTPDKVGAGEVGDIAGGRLREIYQLYQDRLAVLNAVDFGDLLLLCLRLFQDNPEVLARYGDQFTHIMVDEYQDTNVAQYLWLRLLAQSRRNICCVGDDDQSIYGWRGAEVGNILRFEKDFEGAQIIRLEQNYRSTSRILSAASQLIAHNEGRLGKTLWTQGDDGDALQVRGVWDGEEEARHVGEQVEAHHRAGSPLHQMAILVRASFQTREFEERFLTLGVPYRVIGGARFYERLEIRDSIAYLRAIHQSADDLAFERIVNTPRRGLGPATLQAVHQVARANEIPLQHAVAQLVETDELKPAARRVLKKLMDDFERWRAALKTETHADVARMVLDESGYTEMWQKDKSPEAPGRLENLRELVGAIEEFDTIGAFLEHISLVMENAEASNGDQISLMTLHGAKGLEFDIVFLPGWEDGLFPHQRALDESGAAGLEEERRLAYVGLTRARKRVEISFAANRRVHGLWQSAIPSRFVSELPAELVEVTSDSGLAGATGWGGTTAFSGGQSAFGGYLGGQGARGPGYGRRGGSSNASPPILDHQGGGGYKSGSDFATGERVFHQKFGMGTVTSVDADKLDIAFDKAGDKKVIASFVSRP